jgi:hypothetical protein
MRVVSLVNTAWGLTPEFRLANLTLEGAQSSMHLKYDVVATAAVIARSLAFSGTKVAARVSNFGTPDLTGARHRSPRRMA